MNRLLTREQKALVLLAPMLVAVQIICFQLFVRLLGDSWGYLLGYVVYWVCWCVPIIAVYRNVLHKGNDRRVFRADTIMGGWKRSDGASFSRARWIALLAVFLPAMGTGLTVFPPAAYAGGWTVVALAVFFALINAPLEELLWRKVFPAVFPGRVLLGYVLPTVCFGAWHLAPALAKDSGMDGGIAAFAGGALGMGMLWGWYAFRYQTVVPTIIAHFLTNTFAFTAFLYVNWFS
ncbi:CPBP family intramembrane glutamic endopeptidase [Paenibacillus turpanensis]|uniref:CPBP family intramembrane glutamic endopeptidase n=1 Tax=Paenibacillus turpanensis TaxID=2689078 RepID=UPI00140BD289|nr:CPBP family intramembrane glutamic endopeptidase [Paenibacillus turpanensis]